MPLLLRVIEAVADDVTEGPVKDWADSILAERLNSMYLINAILEAAMDMDDVHSKALMVSHADTLMTKYEEGTLTWSELIARSLTVVNLLNACMIDPRSVQMQRAKYGEYVRRIIGRCAIAAGRTSEKVGDTEESRVRWGIETPYIKV